MKVPVMIRSKDSKSIPALREFLESGIARITRYARPSVRRTAVMKTILDNLLVFLPLEVTDMNDADKFAMVSFDENGEPELFAVSRKDPEYKQSSLIKIDLMPVENILDDVLKDVVSGHEISVHKIWKTAWDKQRARECL